MHQGRLLLPLALIEISPTDTSRNLAMDLLRSLGSAAASSLLQKSGLNLPFSLGDKVTYFEDKTIWTLYDATKRVSYGF